MTAFYTKIVTSLIFPFHEWLKKHDTVAVKKEMELSQWWSMEEIVELQTQRLKQMLQNVNEHVPYYKRLFAQIKFNPEDVTNAADLQSLPFLTKEVIRKHIDELKADNASGLSRFNTGGSSGAPLIFFIGKERVSHDVAAKWRATRWWNVDIGDPELVVWGSPIELDAQDRIKLIRDRLLRTKLISAFEMSNQKLDEFVKTIIDFKPRMLFGYPSSLSLIADYANKRNIDVSSLGVKVAFVTSEKLYDHQRKKIESTFSCKVANGYGGRDAGFIAHQCPEGNMHITAEDIIVEIVDSNGKVLPIGEAGEIVVTHLATKDFPFIRYRTGDVGILSNDSCKCGRNLPLLKDIQGRSTDFIVSQDGTVMHGLSLVYVLRDIIGIESFKIIQEDVYNIQILIVKNEEFSINIEKSIVSDFRKRLGASVHVIINYVEEIPREKSGKFRYVVSNVVIGDLQNDTRLGG